MRQGAGYLTKQIYLFYGDEELLIQERINELKKKISDPELNLEQISAEKPDIDGLIASLQTPSLLFGDKLLIIKQANLRDEAWEKIMPVLSTLAAGLTVVFWPAAVDKRSKVFKLLDKLGETCEFRTFADWEQEQVAAWIVQRVKAAGKQCERQAAMKLQEVCGNNLLKLSTEIAKLVTYLGERKQVTLADIEALASPGQISLFALSEAVAARDLPWALTALRALLRDKVELVPLLTMLANRLRLMLIAKSEKNPSRVAQEMGASPYYVKKCFNEAGKFTQAELEQALELILETDLKIKSGEQAAPLVEVLLATICR
jgi:DNA polymerase III subunit delta